MYSAVTSALFNLNLQEQDEGNILQFWICDFLGFPSYQKPDLA